MPLEGSPLSAHVSAAAAAAAAAAGAHPAADAAAAGAAAGATASPRLRGAATRWLTPFAALASEDELPWPTLGAVTRAAKDFLDPVLGDSPEGLWDATSWRWQSGQPAAVRL